MPAHNNQQSEKNDTVNLTHDTVDATVKSRNGGVNLLQKMIIDLMHQNSRISVVEIANKTDEQCTEVIIKKLKISIWQRLN